MGKTYKYEGSSEDKKKDRSMARKHKESMKMWEMSDEDKRMDKKRLDKKKK